MSPEEAHRLYNQRRQGQGAAQATGTVQGRGNAYQIAHQAAPLNSVDARGQSDGTFLGNLARGTGRIVGDTAKWLASEATDFSSEVRGFFTVRDYLDLNQRLDMHQKSSDSLDERRKVLADLYKSGKITKSDYLERLGGINEGLDDLSEEFKAIQEEADPIGRAFDAAQLMMMALPFGKLLPGKIGSKVVNRFLTKSMSEAFEKVEKKIASNILIRKSAAGDLLDRNAAYFARRLGQKAAGESLEMYTARESKRIATAIFIKRPVVYAWNTDNAREIYENLVVEKDTPAALRSAAWMASQMLSGGPLGVFFRGSKIAGKTISKMTRGSFSVLDNLSSQIGNKNPTQFIRFLETAKARMTPAAYKEIEDAVKIFVGTNLKAARGNGRRAVQQVLEHFTGNNIKLEDLSPAIIVSTFIDWSNADKLTRKLDAAGVWEKMGIPKKLSKKMVPVRWDKLAQKGLADGMKGFGSDFVKMRKFLESSSNNAANGFGNSYTLMNKLNGIIDDVEKLKLAGKLQGDAAEEVAKRIRKITTANAMPPGMPKAVAKEYAKTGFIPAIPSGARLTPVVTAEEAGKLVTFAVDKSTDVYEAGVRPLPGLGGIPKFLGKYGLDTISNNKVANATLRKNVAAAILDTSYGKTVAKFVRSGEDPLLKAEQLVKKLEDFIDEMEPIRGGRAISTWRSSTSAVQDVRQLYVDEIKKALDITLDEAKEIKKALIKGYTDTPLEVRGMGPAIVDRLYQINPIYKTYSRVQSGLRYTYNPFFSLQERVETAVLSRLKAGRLIWGKSRATLNEAADKLKKSHILSGSISGEAAQNSQIGRISADIDDIQRRNLAGLALSMAKKRGLTLDEMISRHGNELEDALRVIVQYPQEGLLASPLAKTLNLVFFPMRYNLKVANLAAQQIAKMPPTLQMATIKSFYDLSEWLESDEGIAWRSENHEALQVLGWITPIGSVTYALNILRNAGRGELKLEDMGMLGGLPLGMITQVLEGQGIINIGSPYVDPKTGDVLPDYIPQTLRARASTALVDMLGTTFTYPGRTIGLPGKTKMMRDFVQIFIEANGVDWEKRVDYDRLTPQQEALIRVLKGSTDEDDLDALYQATLSNGLTVPSLMPFELPMKQPSRYNPMAGNPAPVEVEKARSSRTKRSDRVARPIQRR